jgi:hypothetical protein
MLRYKAERDVQIYEFYCSEVGQGTPKQRAKEKTAEKFNLSFYTVNNLLQKLKRQFIFLDGCVSTPHSLFYLAGIDQLKRR